VRPSLDALIDVPSRRLRPSLSSPAGKIGTASSNAAEIVRWSQKIPAMVGPFHQQVPARAAGPEFQVPNSEGCSPAYRECRACKLNVGASTAVLKLAPEVFNRMYCRRCRRDSWATPFARPIPRWPLFKSIAASYPNFPRRTWRQPFFAPRHSTARPTLDLRDLCPPTADPTLAGGVHTTTSPPVFFSGWKQSEQPEVTPVHPRLKSSTPSRQG